MDKLTFILFVLVIAISGCQGGADGISIISATSSKAQANSSQSFTQATCSYQMRDSQLDAEMDSTATATKIGVTVDSRFDDYIDITGANLTNATVTVPYMVHEPKGETVAVLVIIQGGEGLAFTRSGGSLGVSSVFLIKNADLFTAAGFKVVSISRPSDMELVTTSAFNAYRVSVKQAVDIAQVLARESVDSKPVLMAGTSRGTIPLIANSALALGVAFSSTS